MTSAPRRLTSSSDTPSPSTTSAASESAKRTPPLFTLAAASDSVVTKEGDSTTRGVASMGIELNTWRTGGGSATPASRASVSACALYKSNSAVVAECVGLPSAALAAASAGEFLTGE